MIGSSGVVTWILLHCQVTNMRHNLLCGQGLDHANSFLCRLCSTFSAKHLLSPTGKINWFYILGEPRLNGSVGAVGLYRVFFSVQIVSAYRTHIFGRQAFIGAIPAKVYMFIAPTTNIATMRRNQKKQEFKEVQYHTKSNTCHDLGTVIL